MLSRSVLVAGATTAMIFLSACVEEGQFAPTGTTTSASSASTSTVSVARGKTREEVALEREVRDLSRETRDIIVSNVVQGAMVGAVGGCVLARMAGRDCRDGALAGLVVGGATGAVVGQQAAQANRDLVRADETIAKLRGVQQKLGSIESNLRQVVQRQNSEISSLRRQLANGQVSQSAVNARISSINSNRTAIRNGLQASETNLGNERAELVSLEQQSGQSFRTTRSAVDSTRSRVRSLRNSVQLVSN